MVVAHVEDSFSSQFISWLCTLAIGTTVCLFLTGFEICWRIKPLYATNQGNLGKMVISSGTNEWIRISDGDATTSFLNAAMTMHTLRAEITGLLASDLPSHTFSLMDLNYHPIPIIVLKENGLTIFLHYLLILKSQGTTDGISSAPFHTGFLSGQLWLQYGLLRNDETVIYVNSVAALLYSFYLLYYFVMSSYAAKSRYIRLIFLEVIFLMGAHYYIHYYGSPIEVIRSHLGMCCVIFNLLTVAAPLEALREVFRTRCTETMPLPLCCLTLLVTAEWLLYGILIDDIYIKIPNAIASVIAIAQLLPFFYFPRNKQIAVIIP